MKSYTKLTINRNYSVPHMQMTAEAEMNGSIHWSM